MLHWVAHKMKEASEKNDEQGFTLIELLVVVIIIGILAAIAIPVFISQRSKAQDATTQSDLRNAATAQSSYYAANGRFTNSESDLTNQGFRRSNGTNPLVINVPGGSGEGNYCMSTANTASGSNTFHISEAGGGVQQNGC